jgi:protein TonB
MIKERGSASADLASGGMVGGVPGVIRVVEMGGVIGGIIGSTVVAPQVAIPRVRIPGFSSKRLIRGAACISPLARQARIQGQVLLQAQISKDGSIENLSLISGHPMLAPAAIEAVKQWRYKPYMLNGEPVAVDTQVVVNFTLSGG